MALERRYSQLTEMMENYNADFDEKKLWAYGCNCLILGEILKNSSTLKIFQEIFVIF